MRNNILNVFGLGKLKFSASIASVITIPVYLIISYFNWNSLLLNILLYIFIVILSMQGLQRHKSFAIEDPKEIVIDEFLGMYIILILSQSQNIVHIILLLVFFGF